MGSFKTKHHIPYFPRFLPFQAIFFLYVDMNFSLNYFSFSLELYYLICLLEEYSEGQVQSASAITEMPSFTFILSNSFDRWKFFLPKSTKLSPSYCLMDCITCNGKSFEFPHSCIFIMILWGLSLHHQQLILLLGILGWNFTHRHSESDSLSFLSVLLYVFLWAHWFFKFPLYSFYHSPKWISSCNPLYFFQRWDMSK